MKPVSRLREADAAASRVIPVAGMAPKNNTAVSDSEKLGQFYVTAHAIREFSRLYPERILGILTDMKQASFPKYICDNYEIHEWRHALAILRHDFPHEYDDLVDVLGRFRLRKSQISVGGGRKSEVAGWIDSELAKKGWVEKSFATSIKVDENIIESPTHAVDCFKNHVAVEIEWNNKDPFYDRDLNNFRLLFELRTVSVGVIITRCDELQDIFDSLGRGKSYGSSTTHMSKLLPRIQGGGGGGCPLLVFGVKRSLYEPKF